MKKEIYQKLRERILYLEYSPGQILNEKKLAEEFGVSRSPVKDVLNRLEWEEFIRVIPRTGSIVNEIEFSRAMNVYQIRFEIESFEAEIAEKRFSSAHQAKVKELHERCDTILDEENPKSLASIDSELREVIHNAADNPVLAKLSDNLYSQTFRLWYSVMSKGGWPEEVNAVKMELEKLLEYFISEETNGFGKIRRDQLVDHFERLRQKFLGN